MPPDAVDTGVAARSAWIGAVKSSEASAQQLVVHQSAQRSTFARALLSPAGVDGPVAPSEGSVLTRSVLAVTRLLRQRRRGEQGRGRGWLAGAGGSGLRGVKARLETLSRRFDAAAAQSEAKRSRHMAWTMDNAYFYTLEAPWSFTLAAFLVLETAFIAANAALAGLPGVELMDTTFDDEPIGEPWRFAACNLVTMGFGTVYPASQAAFVLGIVQCMQGIMLNVLLFAVIVTKFQRPKGKLVFAENICFATRDGRPVLLIRVGNLRCNALHHPELKLTMLRQHRTAEGESRVLLVPLEVSTSGSTMSATTTFVHEITDSSPVKGLSREALAEDPTTRFHCVLAAHDSTYDADLFAVHHYGPDDFAFNARHADVMGLRDGKAYVDFEKFNAVQPSQPVLEARMENAPPPPPAPSLRMQIVVGCARASYGEQLDGGAADPTPLEAVCPHCAKIMLIASEAGVSYDVHPIDLFDKPAWLADVSAKLDTPATLLVGMSAYSDSSADCIDRLARMHDRVALMQARERTVPLTATQKGDLWKIKNAMDRAMGYSGGTPGVLGTDDEKEATASALRQALQLWEDALGPPHSEEALYLNGAEPGLTDCSMGPILDLVMMLLEAELAERLRVDIGAVAPRVTAYRARLKDRPGWKMAYGGGGSDGGAAMVRLQAGKAAKVAQGVTAETMVLFKDMLERARYLWPPASASAERASRCTSVDDDMAAQEANAVPPPPAALGCPGRRVQIVYGFARASYGEDIDGAATEPTPMEASCCFCAKVLFVLASTGIPFDVHAIDLKAKPAWLKSVSPKLETPATLLPGADAYNCSSSDTIKQLGEQYPAVKEFLARERIVPLTTQQQGSLWGVWHAACSCVGLNGGTPAVLGDAATKEAAAKTLGAALASWEEILGDEPFLSGKAPGLLDLEFGPILELAFFLLNCTLLERLGMHLEVYAPLALAYIARLRELPAWRRCYGGGGSSGAAACVRSIVGKAVTVAHNEELQKQQLYRAMLATTRRLRPPAVASGGSAGTTVSMTGKRRAGAETDEKTVTAVHLCL